eukprot:3930001-Pleurochrysis_carterae.AAC.2
MRAFSSVGTVCSSAWRTRKSALVCVHVAARALRACARAQVGGVTRTPLLVRARAHLCCCEVCGVARADDVARAALRPVALGVGVRRLDEGQVADVAAAAARRAAAVSRVARLLSHRLLAHARAA